MTIRIIAVCSNNAVYDISHTMQMITIAVVLTSRFVVDFGIYRISGRCVVLFASAIATPYG
ncbi:MAG: hypothetical protein M3261_04595, partial [Thermoproteota archaeon]|nr:hypothetical protein [Thermoproteota archaeon]